MASGDCEGQLTQDRDAIFFFPACAEAAAIWTIIENDCKAHDNHPSVVKATAVYLLILFSC